MSKNKEVTVVIIGIFLIIFVAAFTFLRESFAPKKESSQAVVEKTATKYELTSAETLSDIIKNREDFLIMDVRSFEEYANEHVLDSVHVPLEQIAAYSEEISQSVALLPGENQDSPSLDEAASLLTAKGAKKVLLIAMGLDGWKILSGQTVTHGDPTSFIDQSKVNYISQEDLKSKLDLNEPLFILDVREKEDFAKGHLPGAHNIPLPELESRRSEVLSPSPVVIYANMETEAFQASARLYDMKFLASSVLKEGYSKWVSNGFKTQQ